MSIAHAGAIDTLMDWLLPARVVMRAERAERVELAEQVGRW